MARRGHPGLIRELAKEMSDWFENHAATMDAALATHLRHVAFAPETSSAFSQRLA
jgi:hemerythrin